MRWTAVRGQYKGSIIELTGRTHPQSMGPEFVWITPRTGQIDGFDNNFPFDEWVPYESDNVKQIMKKYETIDR